MVTASADAATGDFFDSETPTDAAREGTEARRKAPFFASASEEAETARSACVDRTRNGRDGGRVGQAKAGLGLKRVRRRRRIARSVGGKSAGISARATRAREAGTRTLRAGRRWETRGARSARAEAKETQADIVARASDQWRGRRRDRTDRFCFACERRR